jgi:hypothetical protein
MEPAVRSPRIKSAITTGRARNDALLASQDSQNSRQPTGIGRQNPAAGNGIFGCRDGRLKIGLRDRKRHRRPKEGNDTGENPHRNGLSGVGAGICGFVGLDGGVGSQIRTGLPVIMPISGSFWKKTPRRQSKMSKRPAVQAFLEYCANSISGRNREPVSNRNSERAH